MLIDPDERIHPPAHLEPESGIALCLSGGGYRAMVFHLGAIQALNRHGLLARLGRVSAVSGGAITAGVLGLGWRRLTWVDGRATNLDRVLFEPVSRLARDTVDVGAIVGGLLIPGQHVGQRVARAYDRKLFDGATLADLPADGDGPRFVLNATNLATGALFRFSRPFQGDWKIGLWRDPTTPIAHAVAASSAFPPPLSPHRLRPSGRFDDSTSGPLVADRERTQELTDGGVYDNLGLETAWKRDHTILVSDGGKPVPGGTTPHTDWIRLMLRVLSIMDEQVGAVRKRALLHALSNGERAGTYWGIGSDVAAYGLPDPMPFVQEGRLAPPDVPTRLARLRKDTIGDLVRWGDVIADTALRRWVLPALDDEPLGAVSSTPVEEAG